MTNFATLCMLIKPFQMALSRDKKRAVSPSGGDRDSATLQDKATSHALCTEIPKHEDTSVNNGELRPCVPALPAQVNDTSRRTDTRSARGQRSRKATQPDGRDLALPFPAPASRMAPGTPTLAPGASHALGVLGERQSAGATTRPPLLLST